MRARLPAPAHSAFVFADGVVPVSFLLNPDPPSPAPRQAGLGAPALCDGRPAGLLAGLPVPQPHPSCAEECGTDQPPEPRALPGDLLLQRHPSLPPVPPVHDQEEEEQEEEEEEEEEGEGAQPERARLATTARGAAKQGYRKPCRCGLCGLVVTGTYSLRRHMLVHTDILPFACDECGRKFRAKEALKRHRFVHTGEKPHACAWPGCGYRCAQHSDLTCHLRVHTREKVFQCRAVGCGLWFAHRKTMLRHKEKAGHDHP